MSVYGNIDKYKYVYRNFAMLVKEMSLEFHQMGPGCPPAPGGPGGPGGPTCPGAPSAPGVPGTPGGPANRNAF